MRITPTTNSPIELLAIKSDTFSMSHSPDVMTVNIFQKQLYQIHNLCFIWYAMLYILEYNRTIIEINHTENGLCYDS